MKNPNTDTICAIATATGGAIGIVRVSGPEAISITCRVFSRDISYVKSHTIHYGNIIDTDGTVIDEVLVSVFRAPHSYTGEDSVEISCHGSRYVMAMVVRRLIQEGCRQAAAGEYTQRAFLNGRLDLTQAEAVADLIASTNKATHHIAIGQLRGTITDSLSRLRDRLLEMTSLVELELDFSDHEELEFADRGQLRQLALDIDSHLTRLADTFASGQAVKQGIPVAIVGKTNVGKSTLLNALVGEEKAIVSDIHGTTRDTIEDLIDIHGVTFRFIDTAGLRTTSDTIEQIGIKLAYKKITEATIVLWLVDAIPSVADIADMLSRCADRQLIVVNNKTDLSDLTPHLRTLIPDAEVIGISARGGVNIGKLSEAIFSAANLPSITANDVIVTSARHYDSLCQAHQALSRVIEGIDCGLSGDLLSDDLRQCLHSISEITGRGLITPDEVLTNIFSHFCIGK